MVWLVVFIVSLLLTVGMGFLFVIFSMIALNGYPSMAAAMPMYLAFNACAWPVMVGITTLVTWGMLALVKRKRPFWKVALVNVAVVTTLLAALALLLYFT